MENKKNVKEVKSLEDFRALSFEDILSLSEEDIHELMKNEEIRIRFSGIDLGRSTVYASCGYGCDSTSGQNGHSC